MTAEIRVSTQAETDEDDAATLRDAADVLRRRQWRNEAEVREIEEFADEIDPIDDGLTEINFEAAIWDEAIEAARKYLDSRREAGGAYGQQDRRPSNYGRAAKDLLNLPNPYRKADQ